MQLSYWGKPVEEDSHGSRYPWQVKSDFVVNTMEYDADISPKFMIALTVWCLCRSCRSNHARRLHS